MRPRIRLFIIIALLLAFGVVVGTPLIASAQGEVLEGDRAVLGGSFVLESGQVMRGDLAVLGGTARIEEGARLEGDMALAGGTATVAGEVDGDIAIFGGTLELTETAVVRGDIATLGGRVTRAPGAVVEGEIVENPPVQINTPFLGFLEGGASSTSESPFALLLSVVGAIVRTVIVTLVMAGVAFIVALYLPDHTRRVAEAAQEAPVTSFGVGCITIPLVILLGLVLAFTIIGIPVALVLWLAAVAAWFLGLIGLGYALGDRLLRMADVRFPRVTAAAVVGVVILWLLWSAAGLVPCGGFLIRVVIASLALGAAILTRFGTGFYPGKPGQVLPAPPEGGAEGPSQPAPDIPPLNP